MRAAAVLAATVAATVAAACGVEGKAFVDVAVQPRVVLDGVVELSDRSAGRVVIDEVVAHAPSAWVRAPVAGDAHPGAGGVVVVDAADPLLFRYVLSERIGFGAALGSDRIWSMPADGASLSVLFGSASADHEFDADSDVVDGLAGHTAIIHGTIAVDSTTAGFGGLINDVGPDQTPALPGDQRSDADPDGAPASPAASPAASPEASPAGNDAPNFTADGTPADVDPDGTPADVDPDGTPADVDPDGTPADVDPDGRTASSASSQAQPQAAGLRRSVIYVPFTLVMDGAFEREVMLSSDDIAAVGLGEIMPIDLHVSAADLFDNTRLQALEAIAAAAVAEKTGEAVSLSVSSVQSSAATTVSVPGSIRRQKKVENAPDSIRVSGDPRR